MTIFCMHEHFILHGYNLYFCSTWKFIFKYKNIFWKFENLFLILWIFFNKNGHFAFIIYHYFL
jgi:hypothetical protein